MSALEDILAGPADAAAVREHLRDLVRFQLAYVASLHGVLVHAGALSSEEAHRVFEAMDLVGLPILGGKPDQGLDRALLDEIVKGARAMDKRKPPAFRPTVVK